MKPLKAFTLIEAMIVIAIIAIIAAVAANQFVRFTQANNGPYATKEAEDWARNFGFSVTYINCMNVDMDSDGYVTCDMRLVDGKMLSLLCGTKPLFGQGLGCKRMVSVDQ